MAYQLAEKNNTEHHNFDSERKMAGRDWVFGFSPSCIRFFCRHQSCPLGLRSQPVLDVRWGSSGTLLRHTLTVNFCVWQTQSYVSLGLGTLGWTVLRFLYINHPVVRCFMNLLNLTSTVSPVLYGRIQVWASSNIRLWQGCDGSSLILEQLGLGLRHHLAVKLKCLCLKFKLTLGNRGVLSWFLPWWVFLLTYVVLVFDCYLHEFKLQTDICLVFLTANSHLLGVASSVVILLGLGTLGWWKIPVGHFFYCWCNWWRTGKSSQAVLT